MFPCSTSRLLFPIGSLRTLIETFSQKTGFRLRNIYIIDGSKRSTKANAYFSGFGPKKRIVLYDTLQKELSEEEIVAVLAHEIGHYKKKHILLNLLFSFLTTGIMLFLLSIVVNSPSLSRHWARKITSFHLGLIVFGILYSPLSLLIGLLTNYISRRNEFAADRFVQGKLQTRASCCWTKEAFGQESVKYDATSGLCILPLFSSTAP